LNAFEVLLAEFVPKVYSILEHYAIKPELYIIEWIMTMYTKPLSLDAASRIWDVLILEGEYFLFRAALGLVKYLSPIIEKLEFEGVIQTLHNIPEDIDIDLLMKKILEIELTEKRYHEVIKFHQAQRAKK